MSSVSSIAQQIKNLRESKRTKEAEDLISRNKLLINDEKSLGEAVANCIQTRNYKLADELINKFLETNTNRKSVIRKKADIQHRMGKRQEALYWAEKYYIEEKSISSAAFYASFLKRLKSASEALTVLGEATPQKISNEEWLAEYLDSSIRASNLEQLGSLLSSIKYESLKRENTKTLYISASLCIDNDSQNNLDQQLKDKPANSTSRQQLSMSLSKSIAQSRRAIQNPREELKNFFGEHLTIIQYWDNYSTLTKDVRASISKWKSIPDISHDIYDKERAALFIKDNFGSFAAEAFNRSIHPAQESDIFRLAYIAVNGGIYVDVDFLPNPAAFRFFAEEGKEVYFYYRDNLPPHQRELLNSFIVAKPNCAFLQEVFFKALLNIKNGPQRGIWRDTGPGLIGEHYLCSTYSHQVGLISHKEAFGKYLRHKDDWDYKKILGTWQSIDIKN